MLQIHGKKDCPFAWRVRITAREKELPFVWIPFDVPDADPRARSRNPERASPKLVEDGFELTESLVIDLYLDEAYPGRPLQALSARERALMRLRTLALSKLEAHVAPDHPATDEVRRNAADAYEALERMLSDGRQWLGGSEPDLSDIAAWPFLWTLHENGLPLPPAASRAAAYWDRARGRKSLTATRPA